MDFDTALNAFMQHITDVKEVDRLANFRSLPPTVYTTEPGKKNIRIVDQREDGSGRTVFCFIRIEDGAVLKAAGWKAPAKHPRGTIFTTNPAEYGVGLYGANYL